MNYRQQFKRLLAPANFVTLLAAAALVAAIWAGTLWQMHVDRELAFASEITNNTNLARAHEERTARVLQLLDQTLLTLRDEHARHGAPSNLNEWLATLRVDRDSVGTVALIGAQGRVIAMTAANNPIDYSDREYFRAHAADSTDRLLIGKPVRGRMTDDWIITLTRRISRPDGAFGGVVFMAVNPITFARDYAGAAVGKDASLGVIGLDGIVRVRHNKGQFSFGEDFRASQLFREVSIAPVGNYVTSSTLDGVRRTVSYRTMSDYPLIVAVTSSLDDVTATLRSRERAFIVAASIASLLVVAIAFMLIVLRTRRRQAMDALRDSDQRFRDLVDSTDGIVWQADASTLVFSFVSNNAERMLGYPTADWLQPGFWASHIHVGDRDEAVNYCASCTRELKDHDFEYRFIAQDGRVVWLRDIVKVGIENGRPLFLRGVMVDITARKKAEAAHAQLEVQLRESQKMEALGTMAGGIAHDFNNALATILGNVELAREDSAGNPSALESLEEIHKAGARARDLVQQILSFSRRQPTERKPMDIAPVVQEAARLLRRTLPARLSLEVDCASDVPRVLADATQVEQIVINLANNAMHALPQGPGRIDLRLDTVMLDLGLVERHPQLISLYKVHPGLTVRLTVTDTGMGMDAGTMERIFEPFFTTKPVGEGTGLGLAVVYGMVQGHEGAITVQSEPGQGSIFTVYLPAAEVGEDGAPQAASSAAGGLAVGDGGHRILYIDDDGALASLVRRLLERRGFRVNAHTDQQEALTALRADPQGFDLVLTDYNMPGLSGLDVAREVRQIRADLPVAVASGFVDEVLRSQADEAGVRQLLFKADEVEVFCAAVQRLVEDAGQSSNET